MSKYTVDFSEVKSETIANGTYEAVVTKVELRESKSSEHPYLNWEFELMDADHIGRHVWLMTSLSPKALFRLKQVFETCGLDAEAMQDLEVDDDTNELIFPDFGGMPCTVKIKNEEYQGQTRPKVETIIECHKPFQGSVNEIPEFASDDSEEDVGGDEEDVEDEAKEIEA